MRKIYIYLLFCFLSSYGISQSIEDISSKYWTAVKDKNYNDQILYGPKIVDYFELNDFSVDSSYLYFLSNLGYAYSFLEDFESAEKIHIKSLKYSEAFYGLKNINTLMCKYALVIDYEKLKNNPEKLKLAYSSLKEFDEYYGNENDYSILMLQYLSSTYESLNKLDSASQYSDEQISRSLKLHGDKSTMYLYAIFNSARIYKKQNNFSRAIDLYDKCLEISQIIFNKNHYTYESSLFNLGEIYMTLGNFEKSLQLNKECLIIQKEVYGESSINFSNTLYSIAQCYNKLGDYDKSLTLNLECLKIRKKTFGDNHELTWGSMSNIAQDYSMKGDWKTSFLINQELVKKRKLILTENNYSYLLSLSNLAVDYANLSNIDSSFLLNQEVFNLLERNNLKKTSLYSTVCQNLAFYYLNKGDLNKSEKYINISLEIINLLYGENSEAYIESSKILASIYQQKGLSEKAYNLLIQIHKFNIINYGFESFIYAKSLSNLANFSSNNGFYFDAIDSIQKALPIYIKSQGENHILTLRTMMSLALNLNKLGEFKKGLKINLEVLDKQRISLGFEHVDYITTLINTAGNYSSIGDYNNSRNYYLRAISLEENKTSSLNPYTYTTLLSNYGVVLEDVGEKDSAFYYKKKSLDITREKLGIKSEDYIIKLNNIGTYYLHYLSFSLAKVYFDSAYMISEQIFGPQNPTTIQCFENLASSYSHLGDNLKAIEIEIDCLNRITEKLGKDNLEFASGLNQLASYYSKIGLDSLAQVFHEQAYKIRNKILGPKHPKTIFSAFNLANDYTNLKKFDEALKILKDVLNNYIIQFGEKGNETKLVYNNIGLVYFYLKDYKNALLYLLNAYEEGDEFQDVDAILLNLSSTYEKQNKINESILFQEKAVNYYIKDFLKNQLYLSENQKTSYKQKLEYYVNYLISLNYKNSFDDREYIWYNHYISSKNLINTTLNSDFSEFDSEEKNKLQNISNQINSLKTSKNKELEINRKSNLTYLNKEIESLEIQYSSIIGNSLKKPLNYKMIQNKLKSSESVFVDIIPFKLSNNSDNYYLIVTSSKNEISVMLMDTNIVREKNLNLIESITSQNKIDDSKSEILYNYFWKPIATKIGDARTIYISLGGVYNNINLNTLYNPETGKYLLEEKDIRIVNSARDFVLSKEREKKIFTSTNASLYGFPDFNGNSSVSIDTLNYLVSTRDLSQNWIDSLTRGNTKASPLPATKIEIENISSTFNKNGWNVLSYSKSEASETNLKKEKSPRVLHIATHGYFFEDIPLDTTNNRFFGMDRNQMIQDPMLRSGLLFTGANRTLKGETSFGENGLLSAAEVSLLNLKETELVVLSACETGKGEIKNSEGVYGLRKAFSDAGAQNIIMSLWKVDDEVTQEFMTRFYEIWLNENASIRETFNKTQLEIKAKYPQPYYWGAFILMGE